MVFIAFGFVPFFSMIAACWMWNGMHQLECGSKSFTQADSDFYENVMKLIGKLLDYQVYVFMLSFVSNLIALGI